LSYGPPLNYYPGNSLQFIVNACRKIVHPTYSFVVSFF